MSRWETFRKAIVAGLGSGVFAGLGTLGGTLADGNLTGAEALVALGVAVVATATVGKATYEATNADA